MAPKERRNKTLWKTGLALAVGLAAVGAGSAVRAQYPPLTAFGRLFAAGPEDEATIRQTATPLFEAAAAGASEQWSNPQTRNSGTITLQRIFMQSGMPCRTFAYSTWTEQHTNETRVVVDWCKVPDDGWKLLDPREPQ